ncbi:MAG: GNAT family N-acetyltransferase [Lachnospiraceae bacterium]|nr:GNAT family N-acetyltransferase [Lachnospiraceae bacterium]
MNDESKILYQDGEENRIHYRELGEDEICMELFANFNRRQVVTKCRRRENGEWTVKDDPFIDDWTEADYHTLVACLKNTVLTGGFVYAAFYDGRLKGFTSVESTLFGGEQNYLDLTSIHVSEDMRGRGIGAALFLAAKQWAKKQGAGKLYISAHSAVESQNFYQKMGCVEAEVYEQKHVEAEPYDCQLECRLNSL